MTVTAHAEVSGPHEFASAGWVADVGRMITEGLAGEDLSGVDFSACEVFTDAPAHLCGAGEGVAAWYFRIRDGRIEVGQGVLHDASFEMRGDYQTILPIVRMTMADNPTAAAAVEDAMTSGRLRTRGGHAGAPPALARLNLHDRMAPRTA